MSVVAIALIIIGGFFVIMNWACVISSLVTKKNHSMVPPLGGLLLAIGFAIHPAMRPYAICGLLLDIGFWGLLFSIPMMLVESLRSARWRCVARFSGQWREITFHLSFYRPDYYVIKVSRELPLGQAGWVACGSFGRWATADGGLQLISHADTDETPSRLVLSGELGSAELSVVQSTYESSE